MPTFRYKLAALVASAVIGGVGGSIFALQIGFVAVDSVFTLTVPLFVIVMSVLGGRTHWFGPVLGAVLVVLLQDRLTAAGLSRPDYGARDRRASARRRRARHRPGRSRTGRDTIGQPQRRVSPNRSRRPGRSIHPRRALTGSRHVRPVNTAGRSRS